MRHALALVLVAACAVACDPGGERLDAQELEREQALKAGGTLSLAVDWEAARAAPRLAPPARLAQALDAVPMPVLLPDDAALLESARLTSGRGWYAVAMRAGGGADVYLKGSTRARPRPADVAAAPQGPPRVMRSEGIARVSFARFGVEYRLDVGCEKPMTDPRCTEDAYLLGLLSRLLVAGGRP